MKVLGVDICYNGLLCVYIDDNKWEMTVMKNIDEIIARYNKSELFMFNVPIGIIDGKDERKCDIEVRKIFSSVNMVKTPQIPCRKALYAQTFSEGNKINRQITGRQFPSKIWDISKEIIEINEFLIKFPQYKTRFKECNTELAFAIMGNKPMRYNKTVLDGYNERRRILENVYPHVGVIIDHSLENYRKKDVRIHHVLDATCLAISGHLGLKNGFFSIPQTKQEDINGIRMEISIGKNEDIHLNNIINI